jgi:hypothetical protein
LNKLLVTPHRNKYISRSDKSFYLDVFRHI